MPLPQATESNSRRITMESIQCWGCMWEPRRRGVGSGSVGTCRQACHRWCSKGPWISLGKWWMQLMKWRRSSCTCCIARRSTWTDRCTSRRRRSSRSLRSCKINLVQTKITQSKYELVHRKNVTKIWREHLEEQLSLIDFAILMEDINWDTLLMYDWSNHFKV